MIIKKQVSIMETNILNQGFLQNYVWFEDEGIPFTDADKTKALATIDEYRKDQLAAVAKYTQLPSSKGVRLADLVVAYADQTESLTPFLLVYNRISEIRQPGLRPLNSFNDDIEAIALAAVRQRG